MEIIRTFPDLSANRRATACLAAALFTSLLVSILALILPANLLKYYLQAGLSDRFLLDEGIWGYLRIILAFIILGIIYFVALRASRKAEGKLAWTIVIGGAVILGSVYLLMAPFDARDIYDNIFHGRILGVYRGNPFQDRIMDFPRDPFFDFAWWKSSTSAYGPGWEVLAGINARLAGNGILSNTLAFKLLPGLFHLACLGAVIAFLRQTAPEKALSGALLLGWNPVVLYETWGNGHNDIAMVFWILLATLLLSRRSYLFAVISLVIGTLFKFIPALLIPAAVLIGYRAQDSQRMRFQFLLFTSFVSLFLIVVAYVPFWNGLASLSIQKRMLMFTTSIPAVLYRLFIPVLGKETSARWVSLGAMTLLSGFTLFQTFRMREGEPVQDFLQTGFNVLAFYLLVACLWFQQWYSLWLIGLAPLLSAPKRHAALYFGFWVMTKQLIFGAIIVPEMVSQPQSAIWLEPLLTISVLGVPWFLIWFEHRKYIKRSTVPHVV